MLSPAVACGLRAGSRTREASAAPPGRARLPLACFRLRAARPRTRAGSTTCAISADRKFRTPGEADVHLWGVEHVSATRREVGDSILELRPTSVVVETACTAAHGLAHGTRLTIQELNEGEDWHRTMVNVVQYIKLDMMKQLEPADIPLWQQVCSSAPTEQVAYVAALMVDAPLVYGDRPKASTFTRLFASATAAQLDEAFASQCAANYDSLTGHEPEAAPAEDDCFERYVLRERNAFLYAALRSEAKAAGAGKSVVGIVGSAHLAAVASLFMARAEPPDLDALQTTPAAPTSADFGVRRAILERLLGLRCPPEVVEEAMEVLGPVPAEHVEAYEATSEVYGSCRMLLAMLDREQLARVAGGVKGVDMYDVLAPLRALRPAQGGPGWTAEAVEQLRELGLRFDAK